MIPATQPLSTARRGKHESPRPMDAASRAECIGRQRHDEGQACPRHHARVYPDLGARHLGVAA